jgi:hypothetical protein
VLVSILLIGFISCVVYFRGVVTAIRAIGNRMHPLHSLVYLSITSIVAGSLG